MKLCSLALLSFVAALAGCSRHVVVDPQTVASRNDPDWTVHSAPVTTTVVPTSTQAAPR